MVDPGKRLETLQAQFAAEVRPAEDDRDAGIQVLDQLRHCQAGDVLIERRCEADNLILTPVDCSHRPGQELRGRAVGHVFEERYRVATLLSNLLEDWLEHPRGLSMLWIVTEQKVREEPLA